MKITVAGVRSAAGEPPRSTAYYYADLERLKQKTHDPIPQDNLETQNPDELSEYVESNEVVNDGAIREVPPLRDRGRQYSLPEYHTPENTRKVVEETYSTAGTFPMPEPKEKEPLLAELEVVGRLPLSQLDSSPGVRRSRSWYLCCPNVADEEISRESSWRYSSLRPVTAPPLPGQNGIHSLVASQSSGREDAAALRAERDALARALAAERARASTAARAHDARLAELHGVIAELVRRRAADQRAAAIPEEELSDECESTTQPAGELDNDADRSRTDQNDTSSALSPEELPRPADGRRDSQASSTGSEPERLAGAPLAAVAGFLAEIPDKADEGLFRCKPDTKPEAECLECRDRDPTPPPDGGDDRECSTARGEVEASDVSEALASRDSDLLSTGRCWEAAGGWSGGSCERERGSTNTRPHRPSSGRCESRQARVASRVRLRRTDDSDSNNQLSAEEAWCAEAAERLALDVCAQADLREAIAAANNDECVWRLRWLQAAAEARVLRLSLARSSDTARRLLAACGELEHAAVAVCGALAAADRALEAYDVLLALRECRRADQREAAESVARQLLARLDAEASRGARIGDPLLSPGPWLTHHQRDSSASSDQSPPDAGGGPAARARRAAQGGHGDAARARRAAAPVLLPRRGGGRHPRWQRRPQHGRHGGRGHDAGVAVESRAAGRVPQPPRFRLQERGVPNQTTARAHVAPHTRVRDGPVSPRQQRPRAPKLSASLPAPPRPRGK